MRTPPHRSRSAAAPEAPGVAALLDELRRAGTATKRASAVRVGIPMDQAFGVSVAIIRSIAKRLGGLPALAQPLWASGFHEARLLALLVADPKATSRRTIERWLDDVVSWDLCDHLCGDLVSGRDDAAELARRWATSPRLYVKRAAFATMAHLAVHAAVLDRTTRDDFLRLIADAAGDPRRHIRQALSWALRSIGKRDEDGRRAAMAAALDLADSEDAARRWVGKDALRELEMLKKTPERGRLLAVKPAKRPMPAPAHRRVARKHTKRALRRT